MTLIGQGALFKQFVDESIKNLLVKLARAIPSNVLSLGNDIRERITRLRFVWCVPETRSKAFAIVVALLNDLLCLLNDERAFSAVVSETVSRL